MVEFRQCYRPVAAGTDLSTIFLAEPSASRPWMSTPNKRTLVAVVVAFTIVALTIFGSGPAKASWEAHLHSSGSNEVGAIHAVPSDSQLGPTSRNNQTERPKDDDTPKEPSIDWSQFAYIQYVTNDDYLCNSLMLFEILHRKHVKADKLMLYPDTMHYDGGASTTQARLLIKAEQEYGVKLKPVRVVHRDGTDSTWADSYTKLLAFNQTEYKRVLVLDSDSTVLKSMDELFLLPSVRVAMPRAYWSPMRDKSLSSQLLLVEPSEHEALRVEEAINSATSSEFDMEIMNNLYYDSCLILPHRPYDLLTGEYRAKNHSAYLGESTSTWDPEAVLAEASFLHFSDWPVPKPWKAASERVVEDNQPECEEADGQKDCRNRDIWLGFYKDFRDRRDCVCGLPARRSLPEEEAFAGEG